jgi:hypothetical protein
VIYRRWPTKAKLVLAALTHNLPLRESDIDTGSLRGDLLELVRSGIQRFHQVPGDMLPGLIAEAFSEPDVFEHMRRRIAQDEAPELIRPFLSRAVERGELLTDRCGDRVLRAPFDLLRSETLLYGAMVDDVAITEIVDDIVLPLFRLHCGTPESHA